MTSLVRRLSLFLAYIAGAMLVLVMAIMFVDVVGRYVFNSPLTFAVELVELCMGLAITFGFAVTTLHRGHIRVDLVTQVVPPVIRKVLDWLSDLATGVFFLIVAWKTFEKAGQTMRDGLFTQILFMPVHPVVYLMSLAAAAALVVAVVLLLKPSVGGENA